MSGKKFPLNANDVLDSFAGTKGSGFYGSILIKRPIERMYIGGFGSAVACVPSGASEIELEGNLDWFIHCLKNIVDKCNEAQSSIDSAKDQEIADLKRQLAAAQNDVKQLRQSRDKRNSKTKQKTSETWFAPVTSMDVRLVCGTAGNPLTKDATDRLTSEFMKKGLEIFGWPRNKSASIADLGVNISVDCQAPETITHNGKTYPKGVWIDWHGGNEAPIPDGVWFKVKLRCGEIGEDDEASTWVWSYGRVGVSGDIIAFMIL